VVGRLFPLPPFKQVVGDIELVEYFTHGMVHDVVHRLGLIIKCRHGRQNYCAKIRHCYQKNVTSADRTRRLPVAQFAMSDNVLIEQGATTMPSVLCDPLDITAAMFLWS